MAIKFKITPTLHPSIPPLGIDLATLALLFIAALVLILNN